MDANHFLKTALIRVGGTYGLEAKYEDVIYDVAPHGDDSLSIKDKLTGKVVLTVSEAQMRSV